MDQIHLRIAFYAGVATLVVLSLATWGLPPASRLYAHLQELPLLFTYLAHTLLTLVLTGLTMALFWALEQRWAPRLVKEAYAAAWSIPEPYSHLDQVGERLLAFADQAPHLWPSLLRYALLKGFPDYHLVNACSARMQTRRMQEATEWLHRWRRETFFLWFPIYAYLGPLALLLADRWWPALLNLAKPGGLVLEVVKVLLRAWLR